MSILKKVLVASLFIGSMTAQAGLIDLGVDLKSADRYTFAVGGSAGLASLTLGSEANVYGHVAANWYIGLGTGGIVHGDACSPSVVSAGRINGVVGTGGNCDLSNLTADIFNANAFAAGLSGIALGDVKNSQTINVTSTNRVFEIDELKLGGGETLTVNGGANDNVVINITGSAMLDSLASIELTGGIHGQNVLFNLVDIINSAGSPVTAEFAFGGAVVNGTFLANNRSFTMGDGAKLENTRFYNNSSMSANVQVVHNPPHVDVPEPSTILMFFGGLFFLLMRSNAKHN